MVSRSTTNWMPAGMEDDDDDEFEMSVQKTCQNMKITIVPDIISQAGLNGEDFDDSLSFEAEQWFDGYKRAWNTYKKSPAMMDALQSFYLSTNNPLLIALKFFAKSPGCNNLKSNGLAVMIIEEVAKLKADKPEIANVCTDNMRMVAFNFVKTQGLMFLYKAVADAYDLHKIKHLLEEKLREMIDKHFYKEASQIAITLELTNVFDIFDIPVPLILQDKISIAEEYLDVAKHLQRPTMEFLDSLLDRSASVINNCDKYIVKYNYTDVKFDKLHSKPLCKLIVRLARKYNLPNDATPNVNRSKNFGYVQYLIHKKYVEKSLNKESWREMIREALVIDCKDLRHELITAIVFNNDMTEAVYWVEYLSMEDDELPYLLQKHLETVTLPSDRSAASRPSRSRGSHHVVEQPNKLENFHKLNLDENNIILVDDRNLFNEMIGDLKSQSIIAFDSEWKPSFNTDNNVSLIQLAVQNRVYLIDVMSENFSDEQWNVLGKLIFNNEEILKIGFSLCHDLLMFQKSLPALNVSTQVQTSYLDLQVLWRKLNNLREFQFPFKSSTPGETLGNLVEVCFGKKLDKSNQFSNWGRRPLRAEQISYAALDAFCLLEIYEIIYQRLSTLGYNVDEFINGCISEYNVKSQKSKKKVKTKQNTFHSDLNKSTDSNEVPPGPNVNPVGSSEVKFVCDNMLEGLAKSLRKFGLDCLALTGRCDRDDCVRFALRDKRYVLTRGSMYRKFSQYLPLGHCYKVDSDCTDEQVVEVVNYFNIIIKEEDVFSRCQICNCNEFILAKRDQLRKLKFGDRSHEDKSRKSNQKNQPPQKSSIMKKITPEVMRSGKTTKGAQIQLSAVTNHVLETINQFYICEGCGKIYWDGSHLDRVLIGKFKNLIIKD